MITSLTEIGEEIRTQDNRITSYPQFLVFETVRVYGIEPNYAEFFTWLCNHESEEAPEEYHPVLARYLEIYDREPQGYKRVGYQEMDRFVQVFFVNKNAEEFIERNRHRYGRMHIYVASGYDNPEWQAVRNELKIK